MSKTRKNPFVPCTKAETKELENKTTPIINILPPPLPGWALPDQRSSEKKWHLYCSLLELVNCQDSMRQQWESVSKKLGFKPQYYVNYEYRNAVWGMNYGKYCGYGVIVYLDKRGLGVQVYPNTSETALRSILRALKRLLKGKK